MPSRPRYFIDPRDPNYEDNFPEAEPEAEEEPEEDEVCPVCDSCFCSCAPPDDPAKPRIRCVTNAPTNYDGFSTRTEETLEGAYRLVSFEGRDAVWQTTRYASGMYAAMDPEKYEALKERLHARR